MPAYYNEIDPFAAQWLRNLIAAGHIAPGDVDERSIEDVSPSDLKSYEQCHFFAGIGVWSYALRRAGWPDSKPIWTGSCPCQPFSAAGKGEGFADERHLWPAWNHLIDERRPAIVLGEQVASKNADAWIDLVQADVEVMDYAFGCVPFPSAGIGAPHIRDRNYWLAYAERHGSQGWLLGRQDSQRQTFDGSFGRGCAVGGMAHAHGGNTSTERQQRSGQHGQQPQDGKSSSGLEHASGERRKRGQASASRHDHDGTASERPEGEHGLGVTGSLGIQTHTANPTDGFWRNADWLLCKDGRFRPVEPGTFPLVDGASARMGRLRAYGNAINAQAAKIFIEVVMDFLGYGDL